MRSNNLTEQDFKDRAMRLWQLVQSKKNAELTRMVSNKMTGGMNIKIKDGALEFGEIPTNRDGTNLVRRKFANKLIIAEQKADDMIMTISAAKNDKQVDENVTDDGPNYEAPPQANSDRHAVAK